LPAVNSRPAKTREEEVTTHWRSAWVASSSFMSVGMATFSEVLATMMMRRLRQRTPSIHHRRR
jgi:hypothetical protein